MAWAGRRAIRGSGINNVGDRDVGHEASATGGRMLRSVQRVGDAERLDRLAHFVAQTGVDLHRAVALFGVPSGQFPELHGELGAGLAHRLRSGRRYVW